LVFGDQNAPGFSGSYGGSTGGVYVVGSGGDMVGKYDSISDGIIGRGIGCGGGVAAAHC
jgi:hypothetical protein